MKIVQTAGRAALGEFAPEFAHFNDDVLFGENWNNQDIDVKTRSIITVVALMSSGITDSSLKYHLQNAKAKIHSHSRWLSYPFLRNSWSLLPFYEWSANGVAAFLYQFGL